MRLTGIAFSMPFYLFGAAYVLGPVVFGWEVGVEGIAASVGALPVWVKGVMKFMAAFPFALHGFCGVRYLVWDTAKGMRNYQVVRSGVAAVGLSVATALVLAVM